MSNKRYTIETGGLVVSHVDGTLGQALAKARIRATTYRGMLDIYVHTSTRSEWIGSIDAHGNAVLP